MLTKKEIEKANRIKDDFRSNRSEIQITQNEMEGLSIRINELLDNLEKIRNEERTFVEKLSKKYGQGVLDPIQLTYKIDDKNK